MQILAGCPTRLRFAPCSKRSRRQPGGNERLDAHGGVVLLARTSSPGCGVRLALHAGTFVRTGIRSVNRPFSGSVGNRSPSQSSGAENTPGKSTLSIHKSGRFSGVRCPFLVPGFGSVHTTDPGAPPAFAAIGAQRDVDRLAARAGTAIRGAGPNASRLGTGRATIAPPVATCRRIVACDHEAPSDARHPSSCLLYTSPSPRD